MGKANQTFTAKEKRILLPHWVQNAYKKLQDSKYNYLRWQCFKRAGCLINTDGSDDNKIKPDGIPDYVVPPSLLTFEFHAPAAEPIPEDDKEVENNLIRKMNAPEAPDKLEINKGASWLCAQAGSLWFVHCHVWVFHENECGWFKCKIRW